MNDTVEQSYRIFREKCDEVVRSRYIMSGNSIVLLLRYLASSPELMEYVSKCNQGFRYREEYARATASILFRMPTQPSAIVALVTGMLYEIDRGRLNFNAFLMKFYANDDIEESYHLFCKGIIEPYARALGQVIERGVEHYEDAAGDSKLPVGEAIKEQIMPYLSAICEVVEADTSLADDRKREMQIMTDGLRYAFELGSSKMIQTVFVGTKSVYSAYRATQSYIRAIEKILVAYAVL